MLVLGLLGARVAAEGGGGAEGVECLALLLLGMAGLRAALLEVRAWGGRRVDAAEGEKGGAEEREEEE